MGPEVSVFFTGLKFAISSLAVRGVADAWFVGTLFVKSRIAVEGARDFGAWSFTRFIGGALSCRFCLSYWLSFLATVPVAIDGLSWWWWPVWAFAVRTLVGVLDRVLPPEVHDEPVTGTDPPHTSSD